MEVGRSLFVKLANVRSGGMYRRKGVSLKYFQYKYLYLSVLLKYQAFGHAVKWMMVGDATASRTAEGNEAPFPAFSK